MSGTTGRGGLLRRRLDAEKSASAGHATSDVVQVSFGSITAQTVVDGISQQAVTADHAWLAFVEIAARYGYRSAAARSFVLELAKRAFSGGRTSRVSSASFTKLYSGILDSSLWCGPDSERLTWITMLAMADEFGRVMASVPGLANRARVPIDDVRTALHAFMSADPDSRTKDHDGRRIEEIDGGWRLLNHQKYRELRAEDDRREQNRLAQARKRERDKAASVAVSTRQQKSAKSAHTDTEADADADAYEKTSSNGFDRFYAAYPKKVGKKDALKAFAAIKPDSATLDLMVAAIEAQRRSEQWLTNKGQFIPNPATWLNGGRWMDEEPSAEQPNDMFAGAK